MNKKYLLLSLFLVWISGFWAGKWDSAHGAGTGRYLGEKTRELVIGKTNDQ